MKILFPMALVAVVFAGCAAPEAPPVAKPPNKFTAAFAKPAWFDSIPAPDVHTAEEVSALWQSEARCCGDSSAVLENARIFYKSCYNAIAAHYDDEKLVVLCLWLMDLAADPEQTRQLASFLVENFSHHRNSVERCANCMPGDTVARVTLELAMLESRESNNKQRPIGRIESLLDRREDEISYWVQAEIYEFLGRLYLEAGLTQERLSRYEAAYGRLDRLKEINEPLKARFAPVRKIYETMTKTPLAMDVERTN